jgi:hypothetical protein
MTRAEIHDWVLDYAAAETRPVDEGADTEVDDDRAPPRRAQGPDRSVKGGYDRSRLPDWTAYADQIGLTLVGRGTWRTTRCDLHGGSDSLRVNAETGGWVCMSCGAKGGDVLAHHMQVTGADFVTAAKALGAWVDGGRSEPRPARLSARDALAVLDLELHVCAIVLSAARRGELPNDADWQRFLDASGRVLHIAMEAAR